MPDATTYDVAKLAGASHQTAHRFLSGSKGMRPATRETVESSLAELRCSPSREPPRSPAASATRLHPHPPLRRAAARQDDRVRRRARSKLVTKTEHHGDPRKIGRTQVSVALREHSYLATCGGSCRTVRGDRGHLCVGIGTCSRPGDPPRGNRFRRVLGQAQSLLRRCSRANL